MNLQIDNYLYYRLTSHGGSAHDMYNRNTEEVFNLTKDQYDRCRKDGYDGCVLVEKELKV